MLHTPVLLQEVIEGLMLTPHDVVVDGTVGSGGHAKAILEAEPGVTYIGLDQDPGSIERSREVLKNKKVTLINANFRSMEDVLTKHGIESVDKILLDLGWSSDQFENGGKGFSFQKEEPLLMTYGNEATVSAKEIVNTWSEETLSDILWGFGEERYARKIAKAIIEARMLGSIQTTGELVAIIEDATPNLYHHRKIHFATKTFQALRIAANDEFGALRGGLTGGWNVLRAGGRMAVISFHSGEDRIVKRFFKEKQAEGATLITKRPIIATSEETAQNKRSRSAKLRIIQK